MSIATMTETDRSLAERVLEAINYAHQPGYSAETMTELLADVAAADRLARAAVAVADATEEVASLNRQDRVRVHFEWHAAKTAGDAALDAYRARAAKGERVYPACKGRDCGCTDGKSHSPECAADHEAAYEGVAHGVTHPANEGGGE